MAFNAAAKKCSMNAWNVVSGGNSAFIILFSYCYFQGGAVSDQWAIRHHIVMIHYFEC